MAGVAAVSPKFYFPGAEGGTVDTYLAGTTTRTTTWQDRALSTANENPVELNARGECVLWLSDVLRYKFVVKDADGVTIYTVDNVAGAEAADATVSQFTVDRFSGDGSDTTFTLSVTPDSENAVDVYVSGVYQQKNTFSVAGTTLTFSAAPASGTNNIEVVTTSILDYTAVAADIATSVAAAAASASAASTSATNAATSATAADTSADAAAASATAAAASEAGAAAIVLGNFTQGGTGSVSRTFLAKAREIVTLEDFGGVGDGTTDDSPAMALALTYLDSIGGGTLRFRAKTYRLDSAVIPVVDASATPRQKPICFVGEGCHWSGQGSALYGSTVLDLRGGDAGGKVQLRGLGYFASRGITYTNLGTADTYPFIYGTNTTLDIRGNAFMGHASKIGTACDQDAIVLGGLTIVHDGTATAPFQGYGTIIEGNFFNHVRRQVYGRVYCNGITVRSNTSWTRCGSNLVGGAAIEFDGDPAGTAPGNLCVGNTVEDNLIEMNNYPYGIKLSNASQNNILGNKGYDGTATSLNMVRLESTALNTMVTTTVGPAGKDYLSEATALGQATKVFSGGDDYTQIKNLDVPSAGAVNIRSSFRLRPTTTAQAGITPVGTMSSGVLWEILSGTTDANPDAGGVRFQFRGDGSMTIGGNSAGNVTNSLTTGAQRYTAGRGWGFGASGRTSGGAMEIDTGSGGSALNIKTFSFPWYDHTNTLRCTWKPTANGAELDSDLVINTAGKGLKIKEGSNARSGTATLSAGAVTVANTSITASTRIQLTIQSLGTVAAPKAIGVTARVNGTSFTITSADATDTSVVAWHLVEGY